MANGTTPHILVADDGPQLRELAALILGAAGYRVTTVDDGAPALAALSAEGADFAALVTDCQMTRVHGPDVLARLRAAGRDLPVLLTSGSARPSAIPGLVTDPRVAFLAKPFRSDELIGAVARLLESPA